MAKPKSEKSHSVLKKPRTWRCYVLGLLITSIIILGAFFTYKRVHTTQFPSTSIPAIPSSVSEIPYVDCETVDGFEFGDGDVLYSKKERCYFEQGIARNDTALCKKLSEYPAAKCITQVAQNTQEWHICNEFTDQYHFVECVTPFALQVVQADAQQALKMCGPHYNRCHADVINRYVVIQNMSQRDLTYRCLKYQAGDEFTHTLCRTKVLFLAGWEAHRELLYMYGQKYPEKAQQLCQLLPIFDSEDPFILKNCTEQTKGDIAEMTRTMSSYYHFLQKHPNGNGEPW